MRQCNVSAWKTRDEGTGHGSSGASSHHYRHIWQVLLFSSRMRLYRNAGYLIQRTKVFHRETSGGDASVSDWSGKSLRRGLIKSERCSINYLVDTASNSKAYMDQSKRQITKIAREASRLTVQVMKADGIGTAEFDFIHLLRHHPGMTQAQIRAELKIDKGAAARQAASLEAKGYLVRKDNPADGRSKLLYATEKAENLRNSKVSIEQAFYGWLLSELPEEERAGFCRILNGLYVRSKQQSRSGFPDVRKLIEG